MERRRPLSRLRSPGYAHRAHIYTARGRQAAFERPCACHTFFRRVLHIDISIWRKFIQNVLKSSALLKANKTLENPSELTRAYGAEHAALWLDGVRRCTLTFDGLSRIADDYAVYLRDKTPKGGFIAISIGTCKEWFHILGRDSFRAQRAAARCGHA